MTDNTDQAIADLRATLNDPARTSRPSTADPRKPALNAVRKDDAEAPGFAALREQLRAATDEEREGIAAYWAAQTGEIAEKCQRIVAQDAEFRLALQHDLDTARAEWVAAMAPTTRWEAK
ncbi:hypothetical protein [Micromonospora orduensis]|uniref:hypothetical protein n=1 Tax=Micromonospora orduensis TaxID=1420891 RepID=UPI003401E9E9